jgi:hypothetical protein
VGLYIRDNHVRDLAAKLAEQEKCTLTEAVRRAVEEKLQRRAEEHDERWRVLRLIQAEVAALPDLRPDFTDDDLYDEDGNPIL